MDDRQAVAAADPQGMLGLVGSLGAQLERGFATARATAALPSADGLRAVVVCGMGGSGVAGDVLRAAFAGSLPLPIVVSKGYALPAFCDADSLVIAVSFSGNTEETVAAYAEAAARGCRTVTISAGGRLAALSDADGVPHVAVPASIPVPRAALGYLASAPLGVLDAMGLLELHSEVSEAAATLEELASRLGPYVDTTSNEAKAIAAWLGQRVPVIWGSEGLAEAAAARWKTQFNENGKIPAFHAVLPELDHNEIEGWSLRSGERFAVLVLRHRLEHPRITSRIAATLAAVSGSGLRFREVRVETETPIAALLSLVMLGDFATTYWAIANGIDPTPTPALSALKEGLKE